MNTTTIIADTLSGIRASDYSLVYLPGGDRDCSWAVTYDNYESALRNALIRVKDESMNDNIVFRPHMFTNSPLSFGVIAFFQNVGNTTTVETVEGGAVALARTYTELPCKGFDYCHEGDTGYALQSLSGYAVVRGMPDLDAWATNFVYGPELTGVAVSDEYDGEWINAPSVADAMVFATLFVSGGPAVKVRSNSVDMSGEYVMLEGRDCGSFACTHAQ